MNLTPLGPNMTEVTIRDTTVLFSYSTPVAVRYKTINHNRVFQTEKKWSRTTSRHISKWIQQMISSCQVVDICGEKPQEFFDHIFSNARGSND